MKVTLYGRSLGVTRDKTYPTESAWWYDLKKTLNEQGHDLIKKIMIKDGHLMGDDSGPYYLRDRKSRYCFYDPDYALRLVHQPLNVTLFVEGDATP